MAKKKEKPIHEMFPSLFDGEYYLGTSIGNGWRQIVINMCQQIQDSLSKDDHERFSFIQIKEKFARLTVYFRPTNTIPVSLIGGENGFTNIEVPVAPEHEEPSLTTEGRGVVDKAIDEAERKASRTCEICGGEGRMYSEGYWCIRCDRHAVEDEKIFPRVYGQLLECRTQKSEFSGRQAICSHGLYFKNTAAAVWHWADDKSKRPFVFLDDLPSMLARAFMDQGNIEVPYLEEADNTILAQAVWADDFLSFVKKAAAKDGNAQGLIGALLKVPEGAKVDARTQLERDIKDYRGLDINVTSLMPVKEMGGFAVGSHEDGTSTLFRINKEGIPDIVKSPRHTLDSAIQNAEKLLAALKAARQLFEDSKS